MPLLQLLWFSGRIFGMLWPWTPIVVDDSDSIIGIIGVLGEFLVSAQSNYPNNLVSITVSSFWGDLSDGIAGSKAEISVSFILKRIFQNLARKNIPALQLDKYCFVDMKNQWCPVRFPSSCSRHWSVEDAALPTIRCIAASNVAPVEIDNIVCRPLESPTGKAPKC